MLLQLLVETINNGWRDANGIISKHTIEAKIVPVLNKKLGCKKTEDHVKNYMKTLKGRFQSICQLFGHSSRFGWDPVTKKFITSDEVWEGFLRSHLKSQGVRKETFADYEDLRIQTKMFRTLSIQSQTCIPRHHLLNKCHAIDISIIESRIKCKKKKSQSVLI
ncbi:hypothetical protein D8674_024920 [Pyrus ussuriensis x Pyrus communis]|uniref:Myb/SANT-like domain-containing protein n=1 Tax=Pyrus ussuriensis x Pyrus communis TaxID=2448454 RepID=A0A5N5H594_9ROSA|nr:hypothetical protein D8674_024920 [Pyrus ussuriensis x Pyrus communis]